jgi:hypothetical protein
MSSCSHQNFEISTLTIHDVSPPASTASCFSGPVTPVSADVSQSHGWRAIDDVRADSPVPGANMNDALQRQMDFHPGTMVLFLQWMVSDNLIGVTLKSVDSERSLDLESVALARHVKPARAAVTRPKQNNDDRMPKMISP